MLRATLLFLSLVCFSPPSPGQTVETPSRTMDAVLSELRQLRQDLQVAAVATRRAQILIYRLHVQAAAVERARERLENVERELAQMEFQEKYQTDQIKEYEELKDRAQTEEQRKQFEDFITRFKANREASVTEKQELQAKQIGLEADLRTEQAKWNRLDDELEHNENSLQISSAGNRQ